MTAPRDPSAFMERALAAARSVLGATSPNPAVGAVVVADGKVLATGATQPPGGPHAEVAALRAAGDAGRGATLYVTLEPCSTHGRTPPCTDAVLAAGVAYVVVAMTDPDPRVNGRGVEALRAAGLTVDVGDGGAAAQAHYEAYSHHRRTGRPFVIAKFAASLDGKIAATSGDSRWVSGPQTLAWAHRLRPQLDAILVGVNTIVVDDPQLTARPTDRTGPIPQPLRVVLDSRGRTPPAAHVLQELERSRTLILTTEASPEAWREAIRARGAELRCLPPGPDGRVALEPALDLLGGEFGVVSLLVEGGGQVHGAFFDAALVDKVHAVVAPMIIGGDAANAVMGRGAERMIDAVRLDRVSVERLGDDILVTGYPSAPAAAAALQVRPAALADATAIAALAAADPAATEAALNAAARGEGAAWVAVAGGELVAAAVATLPPRRAEPRALQFEVLAVDPAAAPGAIGRLLAALEGSAAGRGYRWLIAPQPRAARAAIRSRDDWRAAGYRYYRRAADGGDLLIKPLAEDGER